MEYNLIRREYLNPALIPDADTDEQGRPCYCSFGIVLFRVEDIEPGLFASTSDSHPADAVIMARLRIATPEERALNPRAIFAGPTFYRVVAYNGKPVTTREYTADVEALRDAINQMEHPEPVG